MNASQHYKRAFGTEHAFPETWFDFERDILYFGWDHQYPSLEPHDFLMDEARKVQHLASYDHQKEWTALENDEGFARVEALFGVFRNPSTFTSVVRQMHKRIDGVELVFTPRFDLLSEDWLLTATRRMGEDLLGRELSFVILESNMEKAFPLMRLGKIPVFEAQIVITQQRRFLWIAVKLTMSKL
jgi:hypothetical protein